MTDLTEGALAYGSVKLKVIKVDFAVEVDRI